MKFSKIRIHIKKKRTNSSQENNFELVVLKCQTHLFTRYQQLLLPGNTALTFYITLSLLAHIALFNFFCSCCFLCTMLNSDFLEICRGNNLYVRKLHLEYYCRITNKINHSWIIITVLRKEKQTQHYSIFELWLMFNGIWRKKVEYVGKIKTKYRVKFSIMVNVR